MLTLLNNWKNHYIQMFWDYLYVKAEKVFVYLTCPVQQLQCAFWRCWMMSVACLRRTILRFFSLWSWSIKSVSRGTSDSSLWQLQEYFHVFLLFHPCCCYCGWRLWWTPELSAVLTEDLTVTIRVVPTQIPVSEILLIPVNSFCCLAGAGIQPTYTPDVAPC